MSRKTRRWDIGGRVRIVLYRDPVDWGWGMGFTRHGISVMMRRNYLIIMYRDMKEWM